MFKTSFVGSIPTGISNITLQGVIMKQKKIVTVPRERNQFVVAALFRHAGSHQKSNKALRRKLNQSTAKWQ
jgi:hypothetical protein